MADWIACNEYSLTSRKRSLFSLKCLVQIRDFVSGHKSFESFPPIKPDTKDDLGSWIRLVYDRCICLKFLHRADGLEAEKVSAIRVDNFLGLSDEALRRKNCPVATKLLTVANSDLVNLENVQLLEKKFNRQVALLLNSHLPPWVSFRPNLTMSGAVLYMP